MSKRIKTVLNHECRNIDLAIQKSDCRGRSRILMVLISPVPLSIESVKVHWIR